MSPNDTPFPYRDFVRAQETLLAAFDSQADPYLLLTGETGVGKTALLDRLRARLDRCRYRIVYFPNAARLGPSGLVRVLARTLRLPTRRSHSETVQEVARHLREEPQRLCLWVDDAHELPGETLGEARALAESHLGGPFALQVLLAGLPPVREQLQGIPSLWRRITVREEITGLTHEELPAFLAHHFDGASDRLCPDGQTILFEHGRGLPGLIVPRFRRILAVCDGDGPVDPLRVEDILNRWDLA